MDEPGSESGKRSDRRGAARGTRAGSWSPQEGGASGHLAARLAPRSPGSFAAAAMGYPDNLLATSDGLPAALLHAIRARLGDRARPGEPLARYTSFRIGGPADLLVLPDTADELAHVLASAAACGTRVTLLGGGSNVLVGDGGMRGVVVKLGRGFARIAWEAERESARAGAAVQLGRLARAAVARGLAGLEYAEGIPGTVGGALFMNAGAYGGEMAAAVASVEGVTAGGDSLSLDGDAAAFRHRRAKLAPGFLATAVRLRP